MECCQGLAFIFLLLVALPSSGDSGKVLVFPADGSHWLNMRHLIEAIYNRGHEITVLRSSRSWYVKEFSPFYKSITITQKEIQNIENPDFMASYLKNTLEIKRNQGSLWAFLANTWGLFKLLGENNHVVAQMTASMFENKTLMKSLADAEYDLVLTDPVFPGGVLVAHYLRCPLVLNVRWLISGEAHFTIAPSPLSYVPHVLSQNSDQMDFFQRLNNIFTHGLLLYMYHFITKPPYQEVCDRYFDKDTDVMSLIQSADLWLMRMDFVFEFPRPTMPNVVYMGGFQCRPPKPLQSDLEEFVQSSGDHGIVVMSLGSLIGDLGSEISDIFASAFARLPQKVIWRHLGQRPSTLGNNTMLLKWLPQNDLLGHPKTKLFVTHGGTNGLYEAIYHGVPVLGIPLIFDQFDNMVRLKARGAAETVEVTNLELESLTSTLKDLLNSEKPYIKNMQRLFRLHHDRPLKPMAVATFWVEYVMRHKGAAHLRSESYKLPWYAYYCLDVIALLLVSAMFICAVFYASCTCLLRSLTKRRKSKTE